MIYRTHFAVGRVKTGERKVAESTGILIRDRNPTLVPTIQMLELESQNRGLHLIQPGVISDFRMGVLVCLAVESQAVEGVPGTFR